MFVLFLNCDDRVLHVSRGFDRWCESPQNWWRNFILFCFICNFTNIFLLNLI